MRFDSADRDYPPGQEPPIRGFNPWIVALIALLLGMALTSWLAHAATARVQAERQRAFGVAARGVVASIAAQLSDCERLIRTFQSVYLASDEVTEQEFARVYENLQTDRARVNLQALAFAERVVEGGRERYITTVFMPRHGNEAIRGLDVTEQPNNLRALLASRDSNLVNMSAAVTLRPSGPAAWVDGFILRLPD
jgi:CHASE1-domain containing sensor protein